jgi:glycosyltransferase involved in cell wall biosynthesis
MLKICVLTTSFPRYFQGDGACGSFVYNLTRALSKQVDVTVVAPHAPNIETAEYFGKIRVRRFRYFFPCRLELLAYGDKGIIENLKGNPWLALQIPLFLLFFFLAAWRASRNCSLIHANWIITGALALVVKFFRKTPVVLTIHNTQLRHFPKWLARFVIYNVDFVISPHPELTDIVQSLGKKRFEEIPNMIGFDGASIPAASATIRQELGIGSQRVVTYVARLVDWKDPLTFLKSIPYVVKQTEDVKFVLVGGGPLEKEASGLAKELTVQDHVVITGKRNDVGSILAISDLFVALSKIENIWSMTVVEAMTAGVPCIATRAGSTESMLTHNQHAYLIPIEDEKALAEGILALLGDKCLRAKLSNEALELISKNGMDSQSILDRVLAVYGQITGKSVHG